MLFRSGLTGTQEKCEEVVIGGRESMRGAGREEGAEGLRGMNHTKDGAGVKKKEKRWKCGI